MIADKVIEIGATGLKEPAQISKRAVKWITRELIHRPRKSAESFWLGSPALADVFGSAPRLYQSRADNAIERLAMRVEKPHRCLDQQRRGKKSRLYGGYVVGSSRAVGKSAGPLRICLV